MNWAHAEGQTTSADAWHSHTEGHSTYTNGIYAHAEGEFTSAIGQASHASGIKAYTSGNYSFCWSGINAKYELSNDGYFAINPVNGPNGFKIGTKTF